MAISLMEKGNANLHFLDRYLGIPAVIFLGIFRLFKNKIPAHFQPQRIAVLNISSIGDNVLMSGQIRDLKLKFQDSEIRVYCGETNFGLVKLIPGVTEVIKLPVTNVKQCISLIQKQKKSDLLIDFGPWPRLNSLYAAFFKARYKIGFRSEGQYRHYVYDYAVSHSRDKHEIDNFRALLKPLGITSYAMPGLEVPALPSEIKKPYILFHPWPGGYKSFMKEWSRNNWLNLSEKMASLGYTIYITGAPADATASSRMAEESYGVLESLAGRFSLAETASVVKEASLLISVNTGIMHIGSATGTRLISLNGPTSVNRWGAIAPGSVNLAPRGDDCGYLHYGNEYNLSKVNCMELISVNEVYNAAIKQLQSI